MRVTGAWLVLLLGPGLVLRVDAWWDGAELLARIGSLLLASCSWVLLTIFLVQVFGGGLRLGLFVFSASLPLLALSPCPARCQRSVSPWRGAILLFLVLALLFIHLTRQPPQLRLDSDVPAHLGAIHDALQQNRFLPFDGSFPGAPPARDPRMGLLHGVHAALAKVLAVDPARAWGLSGGVFSLMFLICFAWLFLEWGLAQWQAFAAAFLLAAGSGGGASLGIWGAVYPSQFALALAGASGAWFLRTRKNSGAGKHWWLGSLALALSVLVHPFAWWGMCLVLAHVLILSWITRKPKDLSLALLRFLALAVGVGGALALPLMLHRPGNTGQWERAGILLFGHDLFTMDPLIVLRWCGVLAPLAILLAVWRWRRWRRDVRGLFVIASVLPIWTIAFDPLLEPFVFSHAGYLSERLGLLAGAPAVLLLALAPESEQTWGLLRRTVLAAVVLGLFVTVWPKLAASPYRVQKSFSAPLREAVAASRGTLLTDPRTSYALRGMRGGAYSLLPVAHASPLDGSVEMRTGWYRRMLARECTPTQFEHARNELGASTLLLMKQVEAEYGKMPEYGFVPSDRRQEDLGKRLKETGFAPRAKGTEWALFDCRDLTVVPSEDVANSSICGKHHPGARKGERGRKLTSIEIKPGSASPGDSLTVRICYSDGAGSIANSSWEKVQLRFLGPHEPVPQPFQRVSKVYRKLIQEKSLRSQSRFTVTFFPNDGYPLNREVWGEYRTVVIPAWIKEGQYEVLADLKAERWRPVRRLADYLDDRARWSGKSMGRVIVKSEEGRR